VQVRAKKVIGWRQRRLFCRAWRLSRAREAGRVPGREVKPWVSMAGRVGGGEGSAAPKSPRHQRPRKPGRPMQSARNRPNAYPLGMVARRLASTPSATITQRMAQAPFPGAHRTAPTGDPIYTRARGWRTGPGTSADGAGRHKRRRRRWQPRRRRQRRQGLAGPGGPDDARAAAATAAAAAPVTRGPRRPRQRRRPRRPQRRRG
jgi:hypothetical protein